MLFKKEFLQKLGYKKDAIVEETILDHTRWSVVYQRVFKFEDKFYETVFSVGATEYQDESPYEYEPEEIECEEVFPVEKTIIVYEGKNGNKNHH